MPDLQPEVLDHRHRPEPRRVAGAEVGVDVGEVRPASSSAPRATSACSCGVVVLERGPRRMLEDAGDVAVPLMLIAPASESRKAGGRVSTSVLTRAVRVVSVPLAMPTAHDGGAPRHPLRRRQPPAAPRAPRRRARRQAACSAGGDRDYSYRELDGLVNAAANSLLRARRRPGRPRRDHDGELSRVDRLLARRGEDRRRHCHDQHRAEGRRARVPARATRRRACSPSTPSSRRASPRSTMSTLPAIFVGRGSRRRRCRPRPPFGELFEGSTERPPEVDLEPRTPCSILYTSGTTGPAKGCLLPHGQYVAAAHLHSPLMRVRPRDDRLRLPAALPHRGAELRVPVGGRRRRHDRHGQKFTSNA